MRYKPGRGWCIDHVSSFLRGACTFQLGSGIRRQKNGVSIAVAMCVRSQGLGVRALPQHFSLHATRVGPSRTHNQIDVAGPLLWLCWLRPSPETTQRKEIAHSFIYNKYKDTCLSIDRTQDVPCDVMWARIRFVLLIF